MISAGKYNAIAKQGVLTQAGTGSYQVAVTFEIVDAGDFTGQTLTWFGFFTEKTTERTFEALRYAGWLGDDVSELSSLSDPNVPVVQIVIEHKTNDKGTTYAEIRWVNKANSGPNVTPLDTNTAKAFAAKMRTQVRQFDAAQKAGGSPAPAPAQASRVPATFRPVQRPPAQRPPPADMPPPGFDSQEPPPHTDDDIPF